MIRSEETEVRTATLIAICSFLWDSQDRNKVGKGLTDNRTSRVARHLCTAPFPQRGDVALPMLFSLEFGPARFFDNYQEQSLLSLGSDDTVTPWIWNHVYAYGHRH
jgi:hypothetical protein